MAAYADYTYYTDEFLGSAIAEADFPALALRASEELDIMTFDRAADVTDLDELDRLAKATCALAENIQAHVGNGAAVTSEKVGNHAVTYEFAISERQQNINVVRRYLGTTGLLYRGFDESEL